EGDPLVATATAETACGTNGLEGALGGLEPVALRAVTVHVSATPFASPVTPIGEPVPVAFCVPQVTVKSMSGRLVLSVGGAKDTVACALPAAAVTPVGGRGTTGVVLSRMPTLSLLPRS